MYRAEGRYLEYATPTIVPRCGQGTSTTAPSALAGDAHTLFVAAEPIDADPPAAPGTIFACSRSDAALLGFARPILAMPLQYVWSMAVVGSHLLVFTSRF